MSKKAYPTKWYIILLTRTVFSIFALIYRITKKIPPEVKKQPPPYLLLSNHIGYWDPFVLGNFLPHFTHFVSSDAAFRNPVNKFFLERLGTIPKKKNMRDTKVIRDIIAVINQGESVGLFPEAVRNWAGLSFPIDRSIVKLIKLLKVPVIVAVLKGMNLFNPRWSKKLRRASVEAEYKLLLTKEQITKLNEDEIFNLLTKAIYHDEVEYQRKKMIKIHSNKKAENINHTLYVCPECKAIDPFRVKGNDFKCNACGYDIHINQYGFFERKNNGILYFDNIRDWFNWEEKWLLEYIYDKFDNQYTDVIFEDCNSLVYHSKTNTKLDFIGTADIKLYIDRIELKFTDKDSLVALNFNDLQTINPQVHERLEIFYNNEAYRVVGSRPGVSALKWDVAMNAIWEKLAQEYKLSPYILQY